MERKVLNGSIAGLLFLLRRFLRLFFEVGVWNLFLLLFLADVIIRFKAK